MFDSILDRVRASRVAISRCCQESESAISLSFLLFTTTLEIHLEQLGRMSVVLKDTPKVIFKPLRRLSLANSSFSSPDRSTLSTSS